MITRISLPVDPCVMSGE